MKKKHFAIAILLLLVALAWTVCLIRARAVNIDFPDKSAIMRQAQQRLATPPAVEETKKQKLESICDKYAAIMPMLAEQSHRHGDQILTVLVTTETPYTHAIIIAFSQRGVFIGNKENGSSNFSLQYLADKDMTPDQSRMKQGLRILYGEGQSFFPTYPGDLSRTIWDLPIALFAVFVHGKFHAFIVDCIDRNFSTPPEIGVYFGALEAAYKIFAEPSAHQK